jgi:hypothetical protein
MSTVLEVCRGLVTNTPSTSVGYTTFHFLGESNSVFTSHIRESSINLFTRSAVLKGVKNMYPQHTYIQIERALSRGEW